MSTPLNLTMLSAARAYVAAGLSVIPIAPGTKEPAHALLPRVYDAEAGRERPTWRPFQERLPTDDELERWFGRTDAGVGIATGKVSGGLVVLDIETVELYDRWRTNALALLDAPLLDSLPVIATGEGRHVYLRMREPEGNRKLAKENGETLAETRGQGGYVLVPPTLHPLGVPYRLLSGDLSAIPLIGDDEALALFDAARALAPVVEHPTSANGGGRGAAERGGDVIGAFNRAHTITEILETHGYQPFSHNRYVRPGGRRDSVAIIGDRSVHYNTADALYSEAPGGGYHSHSPFGAWCLLEHGGDVKAAVRAAAQQLGLSQQRRAPQNTSNGDGEEGGTYPYFIEGNGIWMHQKDRDGEPKAPMPLCNFVAHIATETLVDDGEQQEEWYTITATCHGRTRTIEMKRAEFEGEGALGRIVSALGARARVNPRTSHRFVLDAIKAFSQDVAERVIHTHTGWVGRRFLLANGSVDADGWHPEGAQLPRRLQPYSLSPEVGSLVDALAVLNDLLEVAPPA